MAYPCHKCSQWREHNRNLGILKRCAACKHTFCPGCQGEIRVPPDTAGKLARCLHCHGVYSIAAYKPGFFESPVKELSGAVIVDSFYSLLSEQVGKFVGQEELKSRLLERIATSARSYMPLPNILLHGETGLGKKRFAHMFVGCSPFRCGLVDADEVNADTLGRKLLEFSNAGYDDGALRVWRVKS